MLRDPELLVSAEAFILLATLTIASDLRLGKLEQDEFVEDIMGRLLEASIRKTIWKKVLLRSVESNQLTRNGNFIV